MVFERSLASERVLQRLAPFIVVIGDLSVLPVVGIGLEVFTPVKARLSHFGSSIRAFRFGSRRCCFSCHPVPFGFCFRRTWVRLGRQWLAAGWYVGILSLVRICRGLSHALIKRLERRVSIQLTLDNGFQLGQGKLQYLYCLLQLRRHHELLPQPEVVSEFYFESHRFLSNSLHLIGQRFIIASFGLLREDHSPGSFDIAFSGVKVHGYPAAGDLVASIMADWTPGKDHGV